MIHFVSGNGASNQLFPKYPVMAAALVTPKANVPRRNQSFTPKQAAAAVEQPAPHVMPSEPTVPLFLKNPGSFVRTIGERGKGDTANGAPPQFEGPWGVAVDTRRDRVIVSDRNNNRVLAFNAGNWQRVWTFGSVDKGVTER
jgi:hypothetical protein